MCLLLCADLPTPSVVPLAAGGFSLSARLQTFVPQPSERPLTVSHAPELHTENRVRPEKAAPSRSVKLPHEAGALGKEGGDVRLHEGASCLMVLRSDLHRHLASYDVLCFRPIGLVSGHNGMPNHGHWERDIMQMLSDFPHGFA